MKKTKGLKLELVVREIVLFLYRKRNHTFSNPENPKRCIDESVEMQKM